MSVQEPFVSPQETSESSTDDDDDDEEDDELHSPEEVIAIEIYSTIFSIVEVYLYVDTPEQIIHLRMYLLGLYINNIYYQLMNGSSQFEELFSRCTHSPLCVLHTIFYGCRSIFRILNSVMLLREQTPEDLRETCILILFYLFRDHPLAGYWDHVCQCPSTDTLQRMYMNGDRHYVPIINIDSIPFRGDFIDMNELSDTEDEDEAYDCAMDLGLNAVLSNAY